MKTPSTPAHSNGSTDPVAPLLDRASDQPSALAHRGLNAVHDGALQLREKAGRTGERTVRYIQDEPLKAVLMAAAAGAALMALAGLVSRSRGH